MYRNSVCIVLECEQGFTTFGCQGREFSICKTLKRKRKVTLKNLYYKCNLVSIKTYFASNSNTHLWLLGVHGSYPPCVYIY